MVLTTPLRTLLRILLEKYLRLNVQLHKILHNLWKCHFYYIRINERWFYDFYILRSIIHYNLYWIVGTVILGKKWNIKIESKTLTTWRGITLIFNKNSDKFAEIAIIHRIPRMGWLLKFSDASVRTMSFRTSTHVLTRINAALQGLKVSFEY